MEIRSFANSAALQDALLATMQEAMQGADKSAIMLSGGGTPLALYNRIAARPFAVNPNLHVMYSDDRLTPHDSPDSNFGNTKAMLRALGVPDSRVFAIAPELEPPAAADAMHDALAAFFADGGRIPLGLLGLGTDGHTASLFNLEDAAFDDRLTLVVKRPDYTRVSVTGPVIARAERLIFLVTGESKRPIIQQLLSEPESLPSGRAIRGLRNVELWTDLDLG
ncbi:MAG: 6-phosphogluconolactonase [Rhodothermales bacterium]|jgi:6-phosphogluconolactonase